MLSSSSVVTALALLPLLSRCAPAPGRFLIPSEDVSKAGHGIKRGAVFVTNVNAISASTTSRIGTTSSTASITSSSSVAPTNVFAAAVTSSTSVYVLPPQAFPTRSASSKAPVPPSQPTSSAAHAAAISEPSSPFPMVMAYYPDWASFPPENIDFKRFDWIDFAFAVPDADFGLTWDDPGAPGMLHRLVNTAHAGGKKVKLSVGGWSGSKHFSDAVATNDTRQLFVRNILAVYNEYNVDGVDIDWEYPGQAGQSGNPATPNDSANFLVFLQLLRASLPAGAKITAATQLTPFVGPDGIPQANVSDFAAVLDWILLMNYDVWGSSSFPGPNAPMYDRCNNSTQPEASAVASFNAWTAAGFPANQIVLGLPSYGYVSKSTATELRQRSVSRRSSRVMAHPRPAEAKSHSNIIGVINDEGDASDGGQVQFNALISQGSLVRHALAAGNDNVTYTGGGGFTRYWDDCSSTPFLRSDSVGQVITYDDPESLGMKAEFAAQVGMLGVNMFDVHGDSVQWDLTDAVRRKLGLKIV